MTRKLMGLAAGIAIIVICLPLLATADAPQLVNYQGRLTNASGQPVPDNNYDINVRIYDAPVGGSMLWHETHKGVPVAGGLFNIVLGSIKNPSPYLDASFFSDTSRWLGITVGVGPEMTTRVRLTTAPYAFRVATVDGATGGTIAGNVAASGTVSSGSPTQTGKIEVYMNGAASPVMNAGNLGTGGGMVRLFDEAGNYMAGFEPDVSGTGGFLYTYRSAGLLGFQVDGNYNGSEEPRVTISGSTRSANFRMDQTGDASVVFPTDALNSTELVNEPGVATNLNGNYYQLTGPLEVLLSRTITLPAAGYVLAIGTCQSSFSHINGSASSVNFGVSTSSSSLPGSQDIGIYLSSALPSGTYYFPVTPQTVFTLGAGAHTLYLLGDQLGIGAGGSINAFDMQLSLIYIPTSYGTVSAPAASASSDYDAATAINSAIPDLDAERQESIESNNARIAKELAAMKAELEEVKRQLEQGNTKSKVQ